MPRRLMEMAFGYGPNIMSVRIGPGVPFKVLPLRQEILDDRRASAAYLVKLLGGCPAVYRMGPVRFRYGALCLPVVVPQQMLFHSLV